MSGEVYTSARREAVRALKCLEGKIPERDDWPATMSRADSRILAEAVISLLAQVERYEHVAEQPWSFHRGSLRERLEWCKAQHAYHAEHPSEPPTREAKQEFDRACVGWYDEMLKQLAEIEGCLESAQGAEQRPETGERA